MEVRGFIHDMLDVKVLILFITANSMYPLTLQQIYELSYQDDCLSYFDVSVAVPEMVASGHLEESEPGRFVITEKGREHEAVTRDEIAYPVMQRAQAAVERFNRQIKRDSRIRTEILPREGGDFSVVLGLDDEQGNLMTIELMAPTQKQARMLSRSFHKQADELFGQIMRTLLAEEEREEL